MKWLSACLICVGFGLFAVSPFLLGKAACIVKNDAWSVNLNGTPTQAEWLDDIHGYNRRPIVHGIAVPGPVILTLRSGSSAHSYRLYFDSDSDFSGTIGSVMDCGTWVAPRLPAWFVTDRYPCRWNRNANFTRIRMARGGGLEFLTPDLARVSASFNSHR